MIAPNMTPPSQPATLSLNQSTTVSGDGGYSSVGTIEGWIQIQSSGIPHIVGYSGSTPVVIFKDPQRLLTLTGTTLSGEKDEFWVEFSSGSEILSASRKSGKLLFPGGSEVELPFTDLNVQFHHFALTLDREQGLSISFDGNDPIAIKTNLDDKIKADLLFQQLTIGHAKDDSGTEHPGFNGKIAGLHLWKKKLTPAEIRAAGNWHTSYCSIPEFGFKEIPPVALLGFLNPEIPSFFFYYEPTGYWLMDGTESDEPNQAHLLDCDQMHHAVYEAPRYFLTTREKETLYIISDNGDKKPLCLAADQFRNLSFTTDDLILTFSPQLDTTTLGGMKQKVVRESFSIESKPGKEKNFPDEFRPVPDFDSKCIRPKVLQEDKGLVQLFGDAFAGKKYNSDPCRKGWNALTMPDPFKSNETGVGNFIFYKPPGTSKCYTQPFGFAVPYGWQLTQTSFTEERMHSMLIANGSDLRSSATTSKTIKGNVKGGCAFVSASVAFNYNSKLGNTEENMYNKEVMHSQHTFFSTMYTLVLDKLNVRFSGQGSTEGFWGAIRDYANNKMRAAQFFHSYGTHYAHAICFGARGKAFNSYTKETMSNLLQNCKTIGGGIEAKISGKIGPFKGGAGGGYSQEEADDDMDKISATQHSEESTYLCIGSSTCKAGEAHPVDESAVPVFVDLRPITELLAPPFFDTYEMTVNVRQRLIADLKKYLTGKPPRSADVFHFLSLTFSRPLGFYQLREGLGEMPGAVFTCSSPVSVKVTGPSNSGKETPSGNETLLEFKKFSFGLEADPIKNSIKRAFCYSGNNTDNQVVVEFTLPNTWSYGPMPPADPTVGTASPVDYPPRVIKLEFALDDEKLLSAEGVAGTFVLPTDVTFSGSQRPHPFVVKFPVVLRKLNLQDAFFNGLPAEWKEAEWKT